MALKKSDHVHITVIHLIFMHICCMYVTLATVYGCDSMLAGELGHIPQVQSVVCHGKGCKASYSGTAECCSLPELCKISTVMVAVSLVVSSI